MEKKVQKIETRYGVLEPNHSYADVRKKYKEPVSYYEDGTLSSIYLEEQTEIETSLGAVKAELLTFYPDGNLKRVFPLYGQINAYWSEEDEYSLAGKMEFSVLGRKICTKPLCIVFYPSGTLRSLTIWQQETLILPTGYGDIATKFGFELTEEGSLKSIEPLFGTKIQTEYGELFPYDSEIYRLHAENNSLIFDRQGKLFSAKTIKNQIVLKQPDGDKKMIRPRMIEDPVFGNVKLAPLKLSFEKDRVKIEDAGGLEIEAEKQHVEIR